MAPVRESSFQLQIPPPSVETPYTPPPLRYTFSEKRNKQADDQLDMETSPSFDDILVMLQDDNERLAAEQLQSTGSLQALEDGAKHQPQTQAQLLSSTSSTSSPREAEEKVTTALSSYASIDLPQVVPSKEYVIEKTGQDSKRYTANFAINLENPENYFGYYSEHFYGNGIQFATLGIILTI